MLAHLAGLAALAASFAVDVEAVFAPQAAQGRLAGGPSVADDFGFFFVVGAAASLPVLAGVVIMALIFANWVQNNLLAFALGGPVAVCLGWVAVAGTGGLASIALATGIASLVFGALALCDWPRTHENPA